MSNPWDHWKDHGARIVSRYGVLHSVDRSIEDGYVIAICGREFHEGDIRPFVLDIHGSNLEPCPECANG